MAPLNQLAATARGEDRRGQQRAFGRVRPQRLAPFQPGDLQRRAACRRTRRPRRWRGAPVRGTAPAPGLQRRRARQHRPGDTEREPRSVGAREPERPRRGERRTGPRHPRPRAPRPARARAPAPRERRLPRPLVRATRRSASASAAAPNTNPAASPTGPPSRSSIGRSNAYPRTTGGAKDSASVRASGRSRHSDGASATRAPKCSATSSSLRRAASHDATSQPQQLRHRRDVRGGGDRQQFGRALDQPERDDLNALRRTTHRRPRRHRAAAGSAGRARRRRSRSRRRPRSRCSAGCPSRTPSGRRPACR